MTTEKEKTYDLEFIEIWQQLGGNRFTAMTGAKDFCATKNGLRFRLPGTMTKNRINFVKITLNSMDTYDLEFISIRGMKFKTISTFEGAYCDMLQNIISARTGLALSFKGEAKT